MRETLLRIVFDLFYTMCYIFLLHTGYNITDRFTQNQHVPAPLVIIWILAAVVMFFLTKERYDKEVQQSLE
jgi:hypothetical protein